MLTGKIRNDIDKLWEKFWTGGITNPLTVIEQISYLMFARMLDMQEETAERKASRTGKDFDRLFPNTPEGQLLRWKNFKNLSGKELHSHLKQQVFPFFATLGEISEQKDGLGEEGSAKQALGHIGEYMQDADLEIKNESVLVSAIEMVDALPLTQSDVKGDIYEYLLSKLTTAGINGQFRTPRHIIDAMIELMDPQPDEMVCDPSCGTAGFLARTMEYLNKKYSSAHGTFTDEDGNIHYSGDLLEPYREHISTQMFWGFDFDTTMLRVSSMNMALHGVNGANILYQDSLSKSIKENFPQQEENFFDVILANPPFKGSLDETNTNPDVLGLVKTKKTELLFVAHILRSLKLGGRAAVIVPDGVLFGSSKAHQQLRQELIENNQLEGIVSLPSGVFKPYAGVSTAILMFTKGGSTERVWFYDLQADGYSLDDKRTPLKGDNSNDLPDAIAQWKQYRKLVESNFDFNALGDAAQGSANPENAGAYFRDKTQKAFVVDAKDIASNKYDLSINRYKEVVYQQEEYEDPKVILQRLKGLEQEILADLDELEKML
ncbi:Type I restriction-modification system, DNA-methyltransferase subunit M [Nitrincola lacisaponensis]|uniref:site-specific DNA-methyltransferase (adenine-specific) n=1 Tax=Nitrincola lacisaponensis TaxID=267850 RepID=A0A063Y6F9_9GAMM|nr:class I SAM-dependent DNA methyltransferase [Nitrincola lacisaponensis]KDE40745.1 Type I restriction-modification system, DNA-methyltransferase subunit M [Nitrincola lacisaponensis]